jgi:hypothetical protein
MEGKDEFHGFGPRDQALVKIGAQASTRIPTTIERGHKGFDADHGQPHSRRAAPTASQKNCHHAHAMTATTIRNKARLKPFRRAARFKAVPCGQR